MDLGLAVEGNLFFRGGRSSRILWSDLQMNEDLTSPFISRLLKGTRVTLNF